MAKEELWPTTIDNPYDYFTQFDEWYQFDTSKGYNTCAYMARLVDLSSDASESEMTEAINDAARRVIRDDILDIYRIARKNDGSRADTEPAKAI